MKYKILGLAFALSIALSTTTMNSGKKLVENIGVSVNHSDLTNSYLVHNNGFIVRQLRICHVTQEFTLMQSIDTSLKNDLNDELAVYMENLD